MSEVGQIVGWIGLIVTAFAAGVAGIRALVHGPREDKATEVEIQDRITAMAKAWLAVADERLQKTESRAAAADKRAGIAEQRVTVLTARVGVLEHNLGSAMETIGALWPWGQEGGGEPEPVLPLWIAQWLREQRAGPPELPPPPRHT